MYKKPAAILFDWDNTLVDTTPVINAAMNAAFAAIGKPLWTVEETKVRVHRSGRDARDELYGDQWQLAEKVFYKAFEGDHLTHLTAMEEGTVERLQDFANAGIFLGVVSNKRGAFLRKEVAHLGWTALFQSIIGAGDAAFDKPHPAPVEMALKNSGIAPSPAVWFVGDSLSDMQCAHACQMTGVLYKTHAAAETLVSPYTPHFSIHALAELTEILREGTMFNTTLT